MQFWRLCRLCFTRNPKHSLSEPKSLKRFVSSRKVSFGKFRWTPRMPSWRTWSFLANQCFLGKTMEKYKIVASSEEVFFKMFFRSLKFRFPLPSWKRLPTSGISPFKISKQSQNYFVWTKLFVSKCFSGNMECCFDKSAKIVSPRNRNFSLLFQKAENCGLWQNFLLNMFLCTRRMPSWFLQISFEVLVDA